MKPLAVARGTVAIFNLQLSIMSQPSAIPQELLSCALIHFESGVPIDDLALRKENKRRLARVSHVYWLWKKNPLLDTFSMFKQLISQGEKQYANPQSAWHAAKKDENLFKFVRDNIGQPSRRQSEAVVRYAAEQAIRIGAETDNAMALTHGGKLLFEVAGLGKPEQEQNDMNKAAFMPTVVVTDVSQVDDTKENIDDAETNRILAKYGGYVDEKRKMIEKRVATMEASGENEQNR